MIFGSANFTFLKVLQLSSYTQQRARLNFSPMMLGAYFYTQIHTPNPTNTEFTENEIMHFNNYMLVNTKERKTQSLCKR